MSESPQKGTVSPSTANVRAGDYVWVTATPKSGYTFEGWYLNVSNISSSASFNYVPSASCTLLAKFLLSPTITGPPDVCTYCPQQFTVTNAPAGFTWGKSSNITLSGSGNSVTAYAPVGGSDGWISINYNGMELVRQYLTVSAGAPVFDYIEGPAQLEPGSSSHYYQAHFNQHLPTYYDWEVYGAPSSWYGLSMNGYSGISLCFFNPATYSVYVTGFNACDYDSGYMDVAAYYEQKQSYKYYPNPASDILTIEIDQQAVDNAKAQKKTSGDQFFDIRLFDIFGVMQRYKTTNKAGNVEIDVSGLPNGIYFLNLHDGVSKMPMREQDVVKH